MCECVECHHVTCLHRETNLKVKQALPITGDMGDSVTALAAFNGEQSNEKRNLTDSQGSDEIVAHETAGIVE